LIKWFINKMWYRYNPKCICGYKMKAITYNTWECIWSIDKCGWEAFETSNGRLHWLKKSEKK
jgi:hypothetical protein